jgi:SAM-dependent methyltransferase
MPDRRFPPPGSQVNLATLCGASMSRRPYYVRDYRRLFQTMRQRHHSLEDAILKASGAADLDFGKVQLSILDRAGLRDAGYVIDVGCGTGRLGLALRGFPNVKYMGIDVVPEMITFAREKCGRDDWHFAVVEGLAIPEDDKSADYVSFFSVITHLSPRDSFHYLTDAKRTLKPGGKIVASFLDRNIKDHHRLAGSKLRQIAHRLLGDGVKNVMLDEATMLNFGRQLGMSAEFIPSPMGHGVCVYTKL